MNLLPAALILSVLASGPALAQQKNNAILPQGPIPLIRSQAPESFQASASTPGLQNPDDPRQSSAFSQRSGWVLVPEVKFVVRDGAVYLTLFERGALIPMAGGGASGCFSLNLAARIENLQKQLETFPPRLSMETLSPITRHTQVLPGLYIYVR